MGDGNISQLARTQSLRISLDARYPAIVDDTEALLHRCFPNNRVGRVDFRDGGVIVVNVYCGHLACLFPQHGPGKKHERPILLEDWQRSIVEAEPWPFLRGCIRSDGCVFVNRTGRYEYLSSGSRTTRSTSSISSSPPAARKAFVRAVMPARFGSTGAAMSDACSSTWA